MFRLIFHSSNKSNWKIDQTISHFSTGCSFFLESVSHWEEPMDRNYSKKEQGNECPVINPERGPGRFALALYLQTTDNRKDQNERQEKPWINFGEE